MKLKPLGFLVAALFASGSSAAEVTETAKTPDAAFIKYCRDNMDKVAPSVFPKGSSETSPKGSSETSPKGSSEAFKDQDICEKALHIASCRSQEGRPIFHFDVKGKEEKPSRILVFSLIHGDEGPSGRVSGQWIKRIQEFAPRNSWRIIPLLNPDGWEKKTRVNSRGVDLNRNFPTLDFAGNALAYWKKSQNSDPRRYPGAEPASELETKCAISHIEDFKPNLIVSIHTPLAVLDFDGPRLKTPPKGQLPWKNLGNYPGSLGRYMWKDQNIPVLTVELKADTSEKDFNEFDNLQDSLGSLTALLSKFGNKAL